MNKDYKMSLGDEADFIKIIKLLTPIKKEGERASDIVERIISERNGAKTALEELHDILSAAHKETGALGYPELLQEIIADRDFRKKALKDLHDVLDTIPTEDEGITYVDMLKTIAVDWISFNETIKLCQPYLEMHPEYNGFGLAVINDMVGSLLAREQDDKRKDARTEVSIQRAIAPLSEPISYHPEDYRKLEEENRRLQSKNYELETTVKTMFKVCK